MPDLAHWSAFLTATIILLVIPGPSVIYVVTRALESRYRGAVFSSLGLALGDLLQVLCTAMGLSVLLGSSPAAFTIIKYVGAAYLIFLGVLRLRQRNHESTIRSAVPSPGTGGLEPTSSLRLVVQGFFALNPKTALFFVALFSQFIADDAGPPWLQMLVLGCAFVALGFLTNSMFGCLGGKLRSLTTRSQRVRIAMVYVSSVTLIALGVSAALAPVPMCAVELAN